MSDAPQQPPGGRIGLQRLLLRALFEHGFGRHFNRMRAPSPAAATATTKPAAPLIIATADEMAEGIMCRFCFDDSSTEKLIAPCGCTGSAKWVHQTCLVKWQKASMRAYSGHESVCSVCNVTYAMKPPVMPKSPLRAGMLLVASPTLGGTFERSVVLLCEVNARGAHGIILNRFRSVEMPALLEKVDEEISGTNLRVEWRRGGPVCGGRLGVTSFTIVHTVAASVARGSGLPSVRVVAATPPPQPPPAPQAQADEPAAEAASSSAAEASGSGGTSAEGEAETEAAAPAAEEEEAEAEEASSSAAGPSGRHPSAPPLASNAIHVGIESGSPAAFSPQSLPRHIHRLAKDAGRSHAKAVMFCGHCRWGRNQLQGEIARGSWELCEARGDDVLYADDGLYESIRRSGRVIEDVRFEEEESDDEDDNDAHPEDLAR